MAYLLPIRCYGLQTHLNAEREVRKVLFADEGEQELPAVYELRDMEKLETKLPV